MILVLQLGASNIDQWMSNKFINARAGALMLYGSACLNGGSVTDTSLFRSKGQSDSGSLSVRPVVILKPEMLTEKVDGVWQVSLQ